MDGTCINDDRCVWLIRLIRSGMNDGRLKLRMHM